MFDVWKNVLAEVEQAISSADYNIWFVDVELVSTKDGVAMIQVPNAFKQATLQKKYSRLIEEALRHNGVEFDKLEFIVQSSSRISKRPREISYSEIRRSSVGKIDAEGGRSRLAKKPEVFNTGLKPDYTFDNFVVCSNNDFAASVAKNIVDHPGERYNPFFLYGGPGLGKTHLVQAIGNALLQRNPDYKIIYTPTSDFYAEFIRMVRSNKGDEFTAKYRALDVVIFDDFQQIIGKDRSQDEFFNLFNDLYQRNKQIIITCDRLPEQLKELDPRLTSRLSQAGAFDLQIPKFEDKCAILRAKAEFMGVEIEDAAIEYLANSVQTNIRTLDGQLSRLLALADFRHMTPLEVIENGYIAAESGPQRGVIPAKKVVEKVAKFYDLSVDELTGKSRVAHIKNARQVAMFLLSEELHMSTTKIATEVGVKDHTTVMHGVKKIRGDIKDNFTLRDQVTAIREKIYD